MIYDMYIITILHHVFSTINREIIPGRFTGGSNRQATTGEARPGQRGYWMDWSENTTERTYYITGWWFIWTRNHGIEATNIHQSVLHSPKSTGWWYFSEKINLTWRLLGGKLSHFSDTDSSWAVGKSQLTTCCFPEESSGMHGLNVPAVLDRHGST